MRDAPIKNSIDACDETSLMLAKYTPLGYDHGTICSSKLYPRANDANINPATPIIMGAAMERLCTANII
jgi:hypothetical protein